jgi:hypothetical protein
MKIRKATVQLYMLSRCLREAADDVWLLSTLLNHDFDLVEQTITKLDEQMQPLLKEMKEIKEKTLDRGP